tara:strand:- start:3737 stop:4579 length:843 start_codon:yes stop_codon:yes gene_type:complete
LGEIKAEEICYYSNPDQYRDCSRAKINNGEIQLIPEYPLTTYSGVSDQKFRNYPFVAIPGKVWKTVHLESEDGNDLKIILREEKYGLISIKRLSEKKFTINTSDIIDWNYYWTPNSGGGIFQFSYLGDLGNENKIKFSKMSKRRFGDLLPKFFKLITNMNPGEKKQIQEILNSKLRRNEKRLAIIKSIILIENPRSEKCLSLNEVKFPALSKEFKQLSKTINPLRKKLSLPRTNEFENICGELPGERPQWMEEKIKGCDKYPTKKQRDYCINVYSPYGKE